MQAVFVFDTFTGDTGAGYVSQVYRNDDGAFLDFGAELVGLSSSSVAWGDYDNDGDLDILCTGKDATGTAHAIVYRNDLGTSNSPPEAPSNLSNTFSGTTATFRWDAAADAETPSAGLSYNLRIGTAPGSGDVFSGMSDETSGHRRVPALGNTNHNLSWDIALEDLGAAPFYWSVQAVDAAFAGSPFASFQSVTSVQGPAAFPSRHALRENVPNPFNPRTTLRFDLSVLSTTNLRIYSVSGRRIRTLLENQPYEAGTYSITWNGQDDAGRNVPSGVYFYRLETEHYRASGKMTLSK